MLNSSMIFPIVFVFVFCWEVSAICYPAVAQERVSVFIGCDHGCMQIRCLPKGIYWVDKFSRLCVPLRVGMVCLLEHGRGGTKKPHNQFNCIHSQNCRSFYIFSLRTKIPFRFLISSQPTVTEKAETCPCWFTCFDVVIKLGLCWTPASAQREEKAAEQLHTSIQLSFQLLTEAT